ncbi:MAG: hypothetical protein K0U98_03660 [Deltaproteobacteria bacterium]|nr:hypothetical protein [Deltaproteobacteria bacterium]
MHNQDSHAITSLVPGGSDGYFDRAMARLEAIKPGLSQDLGCSERLSLESARAVVAIAVELACLSQNVANIRIGRFIFRELPARTINEHLRPVVSELVDLEDDYEYTRLLEAIKPVSPANLEHYLRTGRDSSSAEIRDTSKEWSGALGI